MTHRERVNGKRQRQHTPVLSRTLFSCHLAGWVLLRKGAQNGVQTEWPSAGTLSLSATVPLVKCVSCLNQVWSGKWGRELWTQRDMRSNPSLNTSWLRELEKTKPQFLHLWEHYQLQKITGNDGCNFFRSQSILQCLQVQLPQSPSLDIHWANSGWQTVMKLLLHPRFQLGPEKTDKADLVSATKDP